MSITFNRPSRTILAIAGLSLAVPLALPSTGVSHAAYNVGVQSLHIAGIADSCLPEHALPCTPGAGIGDANVLYVGQTEFDDQYVFNAVWGNGQSVDHLWLGAEIGAQCRAAHHLLGATINGHHGVGAFDGLYGWSWAGGLPGPESVWDWPLSIDTPNGRTMHERRVALNVPLADLFDKHMIDGFSTPSDLFAAGEDEMQRRIDEEQMSDEEARAIPFTIETTVTIGADVGCRYNGLIPAEYRKRRLADIPVTIEYRPTQDDPAPGGEVPRPSELQSAPMVVDAALSVTPDHTDDCRLYLSGTIQTNRPMTVTYRFLDLYGQPSNTFSVDVDHTQVAFVLHDVEVPMKWTPDPTDDLAPPTTVSGLGDIVLAGGDPAQYDGTFTIETMSPTTETAVDGFSVPYCTTPTIRPTGVNDGAPADYTGGANPTHSGPATTTTVPPVRRSR